MQEKNAIKTCSDLSKLPLKSTSHQKVFSLVQGIGGQESIL
jgi:hypothetical protein